MSVFELFGGAAAMLRTAGSVAMSRSQSSPASLAGRRVLIMGLGQFGGGIGAARFCVRQRAHVTITDLKPAGELASSMAALAATPPAVWRLGGHDERDFTSADLIVASPAVRHDHPYLVAARNVGVPIASELNLFWERNPARTICVTGTVGKSTTAALIAAILSARRPGCVWLGGNIGGSLLDQLDAIAPDHDVVLETSSFQLEQLAPLRPQPDIAVVTNFSPHHLDRHGTVEEYRRCKQNILRWQTPDQFAALNQDDPDVSHWTTAATTLWFGRSDEGRQGVCGVGFDAYRRRALYRRSMREQVLPLGDWLRLPGVHNFYNALAATTAAFVAGATALDVESGLRSFGGLAHRLELVGEFSGIRFYNDSKATTPSAAVQAIRAVRGPIALIAGGSDAGYDLSPLLREIASNQSVSSVALLGATANSMAEAIHKDPAAERLFERMRVFDSMTEAAAWSADQVRGNGSVLLSPGCASYGLFANYEKRGDAFIKAVAEWQTTQPPAEMQPEE